MPKRKKIDLEFKCESCGHVQEPDKAESDNNWTVYPGICGKCGARVKMSMI